MNSRLMEVCGYFRDILTFRNYIEIPDNRDSYFLISDEELRAGKLRKDNDSSLLKKWCAKIDRDYNNPFVEVVLIPKVASDIIPKYTPLHTKVSGQAWEFKRASLLYMKAILDLHSLELKVKPMENLIWADPLIKNAPSGILTFLRKLSGRIFGENNDDAYPRFLLQEARPLVCDDENWHTFISEVDKHFEHRTGKGLFDSLTLRDEYGMLHNLYLEGFENQTIVIEDNTVFATTHIAALLHTINQESNLQLPLFENMVLGNKRPKRLAKRTEADFENHLGQMKNDYPLAYAQREVLHCMGTLGDGDVLAVSGPPGTGKTTMLQSVVADMIVRYATRSQHSCFKKNGVDRAPLILASSSNNKAITNIIDAFSDKDNDLSRIDIHHRWLCYETGCGERFVPMAVYCPSSSVGKRKQKEYFITDGWGGGNYDSLRHKYYENASDFYLRAATALEIDIVSENVEDIILELRSRVMMLIRELKYISKVVNSRDISDETICSILGKSANRKFAKGASELRLLSYASHKNLIDKIDRLLDVTIRYDLYWLSVHLNECEWIKIIESYRTSGKGLPKKYGKFLWNEIRYVCPCVVSTFYMAPKLFEYKAKNGNKTYNFGFANLLIVDEAGQVSPEIGLPTIALAEKALVVGDVNQIPPVYSVPPSEEEVYWTNNVKSNSAHKERETLSCCKSSVMSIAECRCDYERESRRGIRMPGLFLNEHRRCVDEIIDFSNELIYGGDLLPMRGSSVDRCVMQYIPPVGIHVVEGNSETRDGSRFNNAEVKEISEWLNAHESEIEKAYSDGNDGKRIYDLVSIITPFKAQSALIKKDKYLGKFPCGTVHTFQGAESPIVIFSLVYSKNDNPVFIKQNHELMNVAVSRAKDHFLVFGDIKCLEANLSDRACKLLYQRLKKI